MAKTRPNVVYREFMRRAKNLKEKDMDDIKVRTRKFNLEAKVYTSYAEGIITKEQCDDIFDILEEDDSDDDQF